MQGSMCRLTGLKVSFLGRLTGLRNLDNQRAWSFVSGESQKRSRFFVAVNSALFYLDSRPDQFHEPSLHDNKLYQRQNASQILKFTKTAGSDLPFRFKIVQDTIDSLSCPFSASRIDAFGSSQPENGHCIPVQAIKSFLSFVFSPPNSTSYFSSSTQMLPINVLHELVNLFGSCGHSHSTPYYGTNYI